MILKNILIAEISLWIHYQQKKLHDPNVSEVLQTLLIKYSNAWNYTSAGAVFERHCVTEITFKMSFNMFYNIQTTPRLQSVLSKVTCIQAIHLVI